MDLAKYEALFVRESGRYLDEAERHLLAAEKDPANRGLWREIHGKIHSIKGMALAMGFEKISTLAHGMENSCQAFQNGQAGASESTFRALFKSLDLLRILVKGKGTSPSPEARAEYDSILSTIENPSFLEEDSGSSPAEGGRYPTASPPAIDAIRIRYSLVDELLGLAEEILSLEKTLPQLPQEYLFPGFKNWLAHMRAMLKGLYFRLAQLRLMSFGDFTDLFSRTVRDLAARQGKNVRISVLGGEVQADMSLFDRLREPFVHLLNNAVSHGIEMPLERLQAGKEETGILSLKAERRRDRLLLTISDDGKGIDRGGIARYLEEKRGLTAKEIAGLDDDTFLKITLEPGYSSARKTSQVAGRGVGMDVVAETVKHLGGEMRIHSSGGNGTSFTMDLPLVLSIIPCILFEITPYLLCLPTIEIDAIYPNEKGDKRLTGLLCDLRALFTGAESTTGSGYCLKTVPFEQAEDNLAAIPVLIPVDRVLGNREILLLPPSGLVARAGIYSGLGVMESGGLAVLLDLGAVLRKTALQPSISP